MKITKYILPIFILSFCLFAKESNLGNDMDESMGGEVVIGIHENAEDGFVVGEDQEVFPMNI